ncbi:hypothetical protein BDF20DRAFT_839991 [Mycotypha africana]|uniref:uncharacterized protein n=1 Tax=Mycotypha africana TaxID=64632 RepID=UPI0023012BF7|nr:uncharacterized protein BDF20DRAFT_839991 [Mycotypha africana]KAI8967782.1 hypothetical protein BDF20DRAFT_839991 [Mycotypha africana]
MHISNHVSFLFHKECKIVLAEINRDESRCHYDRGDCGDGSPRHGCERVEKRPMFYELKQAGTGRKRIEKVLDDFPLELFTAAAVAAATAILLGRRRTVCTATRATATRPKGIERGHRWLHALLENMLLREARRRWEGGSFEEGQKKEQKTSDVLMASGNNKRRWQKSSNSNCRSKYLRFALFNKECCFFKMCN